MGSNAHSIKQLDTIHLLITELSPTQHMILMDTKDIIPLVQTKWSYMIQVLLIPYS